MSLAPDTPDIDPKVKKTVELFIEYLTEKGKDEFRKNIKQVSQEYKSLVENYNNLEPPGREKMIGDKIELLVGPDLTNSLFENEFKEMIKNSLKKNKSFNEKNIPSGRGLEGGRPSSIDGPRYTPNGDLTTRDNILTIAAGLFVLVVGVVKLTPGALGLAGFAAANALLGGSKHKKRKGRKSKKTKKSMKHKKSKKAKKSMKKKKGRKSMKKKKSMKKRKSNKKRR